MREKNFKFRFLKTPQIKHNFTTVKGQTVFPNVMFEIYDGLAGDDGYIYVSGKNLSGKILDIDFKNAFREGVIELIIE